MDPVAILALVVGFFALGVSAWVGFANQRHNRLSVQPHLSFIVDRSGYGGFVGIRLHNAGFGPAIIRHVKLSVNGKNLGEATHETWVEAKKILGVAANWVEFTTISPGLAIGSGQYCNIFILNDTTESADRKAQFESALHLIALKVKFESLYGESWGVSCSWPAK